jgi:hypothetical protein
MAARNHNTVAERHWRVTLRFSGQASGERPFDSAQDKREKTGAAGDEKRHCESVTLTTLADGHTVPSKIAVTPVAPTKVPKLMDTLLSGISMLHAEVTSTRTTQNSH